MRTGGISVLVPVFNEATGLDDTLLRLDAYLANLRASGVQVELIVIDDGSSDGSGAILRRFCERRPGALTLVSHEVNQGLVAALSTGCRAVRTPYTVVMDADLSYAPETIGALARTLEASGASLVLASPYAAGGRVSDVPAVRRVASRVANQLLSFCAGGRIRTFTGMVRAYETELLARALNANRRGEFNAWVVAEALREGRSVVEMPAHLAWPACRRGDVSRISSIKLLRRAADVLIVARQLLLQQHPAAVALRRSHA